MRLGLIGDIHANGDALASVLQAARAEGVEALCVTGDLVGYYHEPRRVLELLANWTHWVVRGNHEDLLLKAASDAISRAQYRHKYGSGLEHALTQLSTNDFAAIEAMPRTQWLEFSGHKLLLAHGAPWDTDEYLYPDTPLATLERVAACGADTVVLGHTHYQFDWQLDGCRIINPGSVGQPRDRKPGAAWSIFDTQTGALVHRRENYDIGQVAAAARHNDPALPYNWNVLSRI